MEKHAAEYAEASLVVNSTQWNSLIQAAVSNKVYLGLGFSERAGDYIYMGQALIGPTGAVLLHRHKLRPSGSERALWSDGTLQELEVVSTPIGRISMLECWEVRRRLFLSIRSETSSSFSVSSITKLIFSPTSCSTSTSVTLLSFFSPSLFFLSTC
jgi:predicted amidohydrolase